MSELGKPALVRRIADVISEKGRITFEEYMELAQYAPGLGYYDSGGEKIGARGDYYTSPDLHPVFGGMIGRQVAQAAAIITPGPVAVVEMGAGKGSLCRDIMTEIRDRAPEVYSKLTYWIVERSAAMREKQRGLLQPSFGAERIRWAAGLDDAGPAGGVTGIFLSNELFDAFPVHRVVQTAEGIREIFVTMENGRLVETRDRPSTPRIEAYFRRLGIVLPAGHQAEVNFRALDWMNRVADRLSKGIVITIDYGYPAAQLYGPDRPRGTFLCYFKHRVSEDPYVRVGLQDMTSHLDFTSLAKAGEEAGLEVLGFTSQEYFLMGLGIAQAIERRLEGLGEAARERELASMTALISPTGMGRVFKVLIQHKGLGDAKLDGLTYRSYGPDALFSL